MPHVAEINRSRVHMNVEPGERLVFEGSGIEVELVSKSGRVARVCVTTPRDVQITRVDQHSQPALALRAKPHTLASTESRD